MQAPTIHVVGAGLAGLAAAVKLASSGARVALYEAAGQAGGRCRSYYEPALDMEIDNGNHLVLSGNRETMAYADMLGSRNQLVGPPTAEFDFCDIGTGESWRLRPNSGRIPWWIFSRDRRVPGTGPFDYLSLGKLLYAGKGATIGSAMPCSGLLYDRLWNPLLLAALNTEPPAASAALAAAVVKESLALGGHACRPLIAEHGLSSAFVDPALAFLERSGAAFKTNARLRGIAFEGVRAAALEFGGEQVTLMPQDMIVLAVPSWVAAQLLPGISVPVEQRSIVNGHFR
ncbi:MAG: FAD-dependent oxidoreductase, partial [Beijerinckiaceae bacterium]|nr:FAD-dependent oxidoreductase [Beijerinckiaceae bacterium]